MIAVKPACRDNKRRLMGERVPRLDVLITTCNESKEVVMDTVRATCVLNYPMDKYRIFVSDDGASASLKSAIEACAREYPHLHYTARTKGSIHDYKAGNLNHALQFSGKLHPARLLATTQHENSMTNDTGRIQRGCGSLPPLSSGNSSGGTAMAVFPDLSTQPTLAPWSEYVAALDADMIPEPDWLRVLLPHIEEDPLCALTSPPQVRRTDS